MRESADVVNLKNSFSLIHRATVSGPLLLLELAFSLAFSRQLHSFISRGIIGNISSFGRCISGTRKGARSFSYFLRYLLFFVFVYLRSGAAVFPIRLGLL